MAVTRCQRLLTKSISYHSCRISRSHRPSAQDLLRAYACHLSKDVKRGSQHTWKDVVRGLMGKACSQELVKLVRPKSLLTGIIQSPDN